jgi:hypothetical protein
MNAQKLQFPTKEAAFKAVEIQVREVMKRLPGQQQQQTQQGGARQSSSSGAGRTMSTVSTGGQVGAGTSRGNGNMSSSERLARTLFGGS